MAENAVSLCPAQGSTYPRFHMKVSMERADQEFTLQTADINQSPTTLGAVLHTYCDTIESIELDATALPDPTSSMPDALRLPFAPRIIATQYPPGGVQSGAPPMPSFTSLRSLSVTSSRAFSPRDLLEFLHFCPALRFLTILNTRRFVACLPEDLSDIPPPNLPYIQSIALDGLLSQPCSAFLDKLSPSLRDTTALKAHFYDPGVPVLQHGPALQTVLRTITHAHLTYMSFNSPAGDALPYTHPLSEGTHEEGGSIQEEGPSHPPAQLHHHFSFEDPAARVQLHWHWSTPHGDPSRPPDLAHIGLASPALAHVHTVSLSLINSYPTLDDLFPILQSFRALKRVEVLATAQAQPALSPTSPAAQELAPTTRHHVFALRTAALLRRATDVPALFARELARECARWRGPSPHDAQGPPSLQALRTSRAQRIRGRALWALMGSSLALVP